MADNKDEKEIDLLELARKLWNNRKFIIKATLIGTIVGLIVAFSIPKEYSSKVIFLPESQSASMTSMSSLAALAGINLQSSNGLDLLMLPDFYPEIVKSTPFLNEILSIKVCDRTIGVDTTLYKYMEENLSSPWWSYVAAIPSYIRKSFSSSNDDLLLDNPRYISREDQDILEGLSDRISVSTDKKTSVTTVSVKMQSPEISAFLADSVAAYLQKYIINNRMKKANDDLIYAEQLFNESKNEYEDAQRKLASFSDGNKNIVSARYNINQERLQNQTNLAYSLYNQMAQELQMAKIKKQNSKPFFNVIQPAVQPLDPSSISKKIVLAIFLFLFGSGSVFWVLRKDIKDLL